jgi:hypothetical protein
MRVAAGVPGLHEEITNASAKVAPRKICWSFVFIEEISNPLPTTELIS